MHELIEELRRYHSKKSYHLNLLEKGVAGVSDIQHTDEPRAMLRDLFQPFDDPTELLHHQNEELILRELISTGIPIHRRVTEISTDHQAFSRIITGIISKIENPSEDFDVVRASIQQFVVIYNDHAGGEESIFFPMAEENLNSHHWNKISKAWD